MRLRLLTEKRDNGLLRIHNPMFLAMFDRIRFCFRILCVQSYELKMEYPRISCFFFPIYLEVWKEMRIFAV